MLGRLLIQSSLVASCSAISLIRYIERKKKLTNILVLRTGFMIVKCAKTGKILVSEDDVKEHADAFGVCEFEEIAPDTTFLWMNAETGKFCFSKNELDVYLRRTGEDESKFSEITVTEFLKVRNAKSKERKNDPTVQQFAKEKLVNVLVEVKGFTVLQAEKALWYTKNESAARAEEWLREHAQDPDFNLPLKLSETDVVPEASPVDGTETVSSYVSESIVEELVGMGYARNRAVRSVWKTGNGGVASSVDWLTAHCEDADIDDEIPSEVSVRPKLSREEAQTAALELQRKLREERLAREAAETKEKEKLRIAQTKQMMDHQAQLEEGTRMRESQDRERAKREAEAHKAELAAKLRQDFIERFGYEPPVEQKVNVKPKERILAILNAIRKNYHVAVVKNCLATVRVYLANVESNCTDKKFHRIKYAPLTSGGYFLGRPTKHFPKKSPACPKPWSCWECAGSRTTGANFWKSKRRSPMGISAGRRLSMPT